MKELFNKFGSSRNTGGNAEKIMINPVDLEIPTHLREIEKKYMKLS